jgi:hypothetical protein
MEISGRGMASRHQGEGAPLLLGPRPRRRPSSSYDDFLEQGRGGWELGGGGALAAAVEGPAMVVRSEGAGARRARAAAVDG